MCGESRKWFIFCLDLAINYIVDSESGVKQLYDNLQCKSRIKIDGS